MSKLIGKTCECEKPIRSEVYTMSCCQCKGYIRMSQRTRPPYFEIMFKLDFRHPQWKPWHTGFRHGTFNCGWACFYIHSQYYWK